MNKIVILEIKFMLLFLWVLYGSYKRSELDKRVNALANKEAEVWLRVSKIEDSLITKK